MIKKLKFGLLILLFSLLSMTLIAQSPYSLKKDTLQLTKIAVVDTKNRIIVNSFEYIKIKDVFFDATYEIPLRYPVCFYVNNEVLYKFEDDINFRRQNRFLKHYWRKIMKPINSDTTFKDSTVLKFLKDTYLKNDNDSSYSFYIKTVYVYTTYYIVNCRNENFNTWGENSSNIFKPSFFIFMMNYTKWW